MVGQVIEGTIFLILVFLVLANAGSFSTVAGAIGSNYVNAVKTLQGRG